MIWYMTLQWQEKVKRTKNTILTDIPEDEYILNAAIVSSELLQVQLFNVPNECFFRTNDLVYRTIRMNLLLTKTRA
ncbi:hypothetical protein BpHYR1_002736 [Brachionus plicatilis]|uniref:Uncharacterized protein n=1 Tax=Brachionus plicatilis TaxID=10195 RepID=A0A3M7Q0T8_BRAPC|nr:hypothetical protein BpHYR1_002736 [Brachionus plicatilis]